jgi:predicted dehydrogenase
MNVLMIGMGMVAQTHLLALRDNTSGLRLGAVLGRDADRTAEFCDAAAQMLGYPVTPFTTLTTALAGKPDMAIVLTPPNARLAYSEALVAARVPTLFEKPVERTLAAARSVAKAYQEAAVPIGICFQHRMRAAARDLKKRLESGTLGDVIHVEMRVPWWRDQAYYDAPGRGSYARDGGGVMINQAIHTLDLALWLAGPVAQVQAAMRNSALHIMEAEDIASALFDFASGASGVLSATTTAYPGSAETIAVTTTRAHVTLEGENLTIAWINGIVDTLGYGRAVGTGDGANPMAFTHAWHKGVIENFAKVIGSGTPPVATAKEALHVHAVIDAMEHAARSGKRTEVSV